MFSQLLVIFVFYQLTKIVNPWFCFWKRGGGCPGVFISLISYQSASQPNLAQKEHAFTPSLQLIFTSSNSRKLQFFPCSMSLFSWNFWIFQWIFRVCSVLPWLSIDPGRPFPHRYHPSLSPVITTGNHYRDYGYQSFTHLGHVGCFGNYSSSSFPFCLRLSLLSTLSHSLCLFLCVHVFCPVRIKTFFSNFPFSSFAWNCSTSMVSVLPERFYRFVLDYCTYSNPLVLQTFFYRKLLLRYYHLTPYHTPTTPAARFFFLSFWDFFQIITVIPRLRYNIFLKLKTVPVSNTEHPLVPPPPLLDYCSFGYSNPFNFFKFLKNRMRSVRVRVDVDMWLTLKNLIFRNNIFFRWSCQFQTGSSNWTFEKVSFLLIFEFLFHFKILETCK